MTSLRRFPYVLLYLCLLLHHIQAFFIANNNCHPQVRLSNSYSLGHQNRPKQCSIITLKRSQLSMSILPLTRSNMKSMSHRRVTTEQWKSYWGVNKTERLQKVLESLLISYGGTWMAWFLSFMAGAYVSAFIGTALIFNWMYSPWLYAKKRNAKLWPLNQILHYALYAGRISKLSRVRRRAGKTIGAVSQEFLVMTVEDEKGRKLEIITQWQEAYKNLRRHMQCETVIASPSSYFDALAMVTEVLVPACNLWVGDYPYLDRKKFKKFVSSMGKNRKKINYLGQNNDNIDNDDYGGNDGDYGDDDGSMDEVYDRRRSEEESFYEYDEDDIVVVGKASSSSWNGNPPPPEKSFQASIGETMRR